jgi:hypothetical protein
MSLWSTIEWRSREPVEPALPTRDLDREEDRDRARPSIASGDDRDGDVDDTGYEDAGADAPAPAPPRLGNAVRFREPGVVVREQRGAPGQEMGDMGRVGASQLSADECVRFSTGVDADDGRP